MIDHEDDLRDHDVHHSHVYVATDRGDECEVCGHVREPVDEAEDIELDDDQDVEDEAHLPDYDFEGGCG